VVGWQFLAGLGMAAGGALLLIIYEVAHLSGFGFGQSVYQISDYDEGVYLETGALVSHGYHLYAQIYSAQPPIFPLAIAAADKMAGFSVPNARLVVLAFALLGLLSAAMIGYCIQGWPAAGVGALVLALSPEMLVYAHAIEEEVPAMALSGLSVALGLVWWRRLSMGRTTLSRRLGVPAFGAGLSLGLAVLTKFFAFAALAPLTVMLSLALWEGRRRRAEPRAAQLGTILWGPLLAGIGFILPIAVSFAFFGLDEWRQMVADRVRASTTYPSAQTTVSNLHQILTFGLVDVGLVVLALAGALLLLLQSWRMGLVLGSWALATLLILARYHPLMGHHPVMLLEPAATLAAGAVIGLLPGTWRDDGRWMSGRGATRLAAVVALACYLVLLPRLFLAYPRLLTHPARDDRAQAGTLIRSHTPPGSFVASGDAWICVDADRLCVPGLVDTSYVRIFTGKLTAAEAVAQTRSVNAAAVALWPRFRPAPGYHFMDAYFRWVRGRYRLLERFTCSGSAPTGCDAVYVR